jgi:LysM repeat protein
MPARLPQLRRSLGPWLLGAGALLVALALGVVILAPSRLSSSPLLGPLASIVAPQSTEVPPQAAASAPEPTLVAVQNQTAQTETSTAPQAAPAASQTEPASPFAGISTPPPEPPKRTGMVHHLVTSGEVLWQIADQYGLRPETVVWANDLDNPDLLQVGEDLLIPPEDGVLYTIRPGDRLADVVVRYGVDFQAVVAANGLADADQIVAGTDIFLPGGRPIAITPASTADGVAAPANPDAEQDTAVVGAAVALPDNIDDLLSAGWLSTLHGTGLLKTADRGSTLLHALPGGARLERLDGFKNGRIQVRDPGDGKTRQAMTGWVSAVDVDLGRGPAARELPQAYPLDTAMDISHVFAPYRSQLDGAPFAEANCGPTALGMALDAFGLDIAPRELRAEALEAQHMYGNGVGTLITALAQVVQEHGLSALDLRDEDGNLRHWGLDDIRAHIQAGHPVIVQVRYRSLPGRGGAYYFGDHYILVTGIVGDGFLYNDPIDIDGLGWDRTISGGALRVAMNASDQRYAYTAVAVAR